MLVSKFINYAVIFFYIVERLLELIVNQRNKIILVNNYSAKLKYPSEALQMKLFHINWFILLIAETYFIGDRLTGLGLYVCAIFLIMAQTLRWYAIYTLGVFWSVNIYELKKHPVIVSGPYAIFRHPNYLAVVIEFIFLPLFLGCFNTLIIGSIANFLILKRRIYLEELTLNEQSNGFYKKLKG